MIRKRVVIALGNYQTERIEVEFPVQLPPPGLMRANGKRPPCFFGRPKLARHHARRLKCVGKPGGSRYSLHDEHSRFRRPHDRCRLATETEVFIMDRLCQPPPKMDCPFGKRPTRRQESEDDTPSGGSNPGGSDPCTKFAEAGDVVGLLAWLRSRSVLHLPPGSLDQVAKAIRTLERDNVGALVEVAYAEVIGLVTTLLVRYQIHIERRLAECDSYGGNPVHMPQDLLDEDWLGRVERISRFLMEVTTTRERVRHLARLNTNARRSPINLNWLNGSPMDGDPGQARNGQATSGNGRIRSPESRIEFP